MSIVRISASNTGGYGTKVQFGENSGTYGAIRFGYSSHTVTAEPWRARMQAFGYFDSANTVKASSNAVNLSFQQFNVENGMSATRIDFLQAYSQGGSTAGSMTFRLALYTVSGSTAGAVSTASVVVTHSSGGADATNVAGYSAQSGTQWRSLALGTWAITPGEYLLGVMASIDGPAGSTGSLTMYGRSAISIANGAILGAANPVNHWADGGLFSAGTSAPPASIHISDVNRTGSYAIAQPGFRLLASF